MQENTQNNQTSKRKMSPAVKFALENGWLEQFLNINLTKIREAKKNESRK